MHNNMNEINDTNNAFVIAYYIQTIICKRSSKTMNYL